MGFGMGSVVLLATVALACNACATGCTNGYICYALTAEQRKNTDFAQEECDCLLAPEWQRLHEEGVDAILKKL